MEPNLTRVKCHLTDCIYYAEKPGEPGVSYCKHADVLLHKDNLHCPLYRVDWAKKLEAAEWLNKRLQH